MASVSSTISLIDNMSGALATIESNINSLKDSLKGVEDAGDSLNGANFSNFLASAEKAGKRMTEIGKEMSLALTAPLIMLGKEMFNAATDYEAAFAGMTKTVKGTAEQHEHLNEVVLQLSETTPSSYTELMGIAQQGGNFRSMSDSWVLMDQFAEVSGKTTDQFVKDWSTSPVQAMSDFFTGLSQLGENGGESILATLDKMGLTEIRESNLIAAMASRPELFASAIQTAVEAYGANTALWEEFGKQTSTQEAQNQMLANKLHNTMADFGDNLVKALQPALDMVNNILDAFNNLSEVDQTNILKGLAVIAALGPGLTIVGTAIKTIAAAMQLISGHGKEAADAVQGVVDAANNAKTTGAAAETAGLSTGSKIIGGVALLQSAGLYTKT